MNHALFSLFLPLIAGLALGFFFFGTLWMTVRRIPRAKRPQLFLLLSFWLRMGMVVLGFYLVMHGSWRRLLACVAGFMIMRRIMVKRLGPEREYLRMKSSTL